MEIAISGRKSDGWKVYGVGALICLGLFARDMLNVGFNKYIFLLLAAIPIFLASLSNVVVFASFLIPLYVGLPGNYISVCLLVRLVYEACRRRIRLDAQGLILSYLVAAYILVQSFITGYTGIFHIMAALDFINLYLLMSAILQKRRGIEATIAYTVGVLMTGIIMLGSTLSYYSLVDLMNPATRLGYTGMLLHNSGASMATSIDPNFYAMNVIAAIATGSLVLTRGVSKPMRVPLVVMMVGSAICCLIGLSRTFVVVLAAWAVLWLLCQGNIKRTFAILAAAAVLMIAFFNFFPTIASGLMSRFSGSDMAGGNGRIKLILLYFAPWFESPQTILFGIGLFNCHTHCAPLLYLFGMGIVGILPLFWWFVRYCSACVHYTAKATIRQWIPLIVTFICFSSIPAAGAINYTFPMIIAITALSFRDQPVGNR